jgi:hypothetical protein
MAQSKGVRGEDSTVPWDSTDGCPLEQGDSYSSRNDPVKKGERDRPGRTSRRLAEWSLANPQRTRRYVGAARWSFRRDVASCGPKNNGIVQVKTAWRSQASQPSEPDRRAIPRTFFS